MDLEKRTRLEVIQSRNNIQIKLIAIKRTSLIRLENHQNLCNFMIENIPILLSLASLSTLFKTTEELTFNSKKRNKHKLSNIK